MAAEAEADCLPKDEVAQFFDQFYVIVAETKEEEAMLKVKETEKLLAANPGSTEIQEALLKHKISYGDAKERTKQAIAARDASVALGLIPALDTTSTYILGQGGYGTVYRYKKDYVIKFIYAKTDYIEREFEKETKSWASLWEIEEFHDFMPYFCWSAYSKRERIGIIVQKFEDTRTLQDYIDFYAKKTNPPFPYDKGLLIMQEIEDLIWRLHAKGYIHRDLKPANILLRVNTGSEVRELTPILIDFGMVCKLPCEDRDRKGTPGFMPGNWFSPQNPRGRIAERRYISHGHIMPPWELPRPMPAGTKKLRVQPFTVAPEYSKRTDMFSLAQIFALLVPLIDWTSGTEAEKKVKKEKKIEILSHIRDLRELGAGTVAATFAASLPEAFLNRREAELGMLNRNLNLIARRNRLALYAQEKAEKVATAKTKKAKREAKAAAMKAAEAAELAAAAAAGIQERAFNERKARAAAVLADPVGTAIAAQAEKKAAADTAAAALLNLGAVAATPVAPRVGLAGKKRGAQNTTNTRTRKAAKKG